MPSVERCNFVIRLNKTTTPKLEIKAESLIEIGHMAQYCGNDAYNERVAYENTLAGRYRLSFFAKSTLKPLNLLLVYRRRRRTTLSVWNRQSNDWFRLQTTTANDADCGE